MRIGLPAAVAKAAVGADLWASGGKAQLAELQEDLDRSTATIHLQEADLEDLFVELTTAPKAGDDTRKS